MKIAIQLLAFLLFPELVFAQNTNWEVKGKISDSSNSAVSLASVYVNNSSIGTNSDQNGSFTLIIPERFQKIELVVSRKGYETLHEVFEASEENILNLTLQQNIKSKTTTTNPKDIENSKIWKAFSRELLGDSEFAKDCKILNPEVVSLAYNESKKIIASTYEPLIIQNDAFGLKIKLEIENFDSNNLTTAFTGFKYFEKLTPVSVNEQKQWNKHKNKAYKESLQNFLIALKNNKLRENGFEIFKVLKTADVSMGKTSIAQQITEGILKPCEAKEICMFDNATEEFIFHTEHTLMVFVKNRHSAIRIFTDYPYEYSIVNLTNSFIGFDENGATLTPDKIQKQGFWANGLAITLPSDYLPE
jgi:CarboxypepD_reg-like domain